MEDLEKNELKERIKELERKIEKLKKQNTYKTEIKVKKPISIIISAYEAQDFIEECLDSVYEQTYPINRILVGVDNCEKTLNKLKDISQKYHNLEIFWANINTGPYMVFNSLISMIPDDEYFLIFGADDIMDVDMVEKLAQTEQTKICKHDGILFINKNIFNKIGGYRPWRCAADSDCIKRLRKITTVKRTEQFYFLRKHENQLTNRSETGYNSELRKSYINIMNTDNATYIKPECNHLERIYLDKPITVNMATYPNRKDVFLTCINNLLEISLINKIRIYLNEYSEIPNDFPISHNIEYHIGKENLKDSGKFYWAYENNNVYYFTVDDDLLYNEYYFLYHISKMKKYQNKIFVTTHGKNTLNQTPNSLMDVQKPIFHCLKSLSNDEWVMIGGTGVMVFDNSIYKLPVDFIEYHGMCDLWIALYCQYNRIPILCREHKHNEIKLINLENNDTLWEKRNEMLEQHQNIFKRTKWIKYKLPI